nr:MADS-box transcription factor 31-like isoform X2 [Quercus suber]
MGPKVDMKKIENPTKCQVAFSKRRSSLFRKTHEISVLCDVDLALIAFSPSGRLNQFCSQKRIEDVMQRYIDLPPDKRFRHIKNIEKTQQMLSQLGHLKDEESKMHYINNQISVSSFVLEFPFEQIIDFVLIIISMFNNFDYVSPKLTELKLKKSKIEHEILAANLRDYEPEPERDPSLAQLLWCEKNLKTSLQRVMNKKELCLGICHLHMRISQFRVMIRQSRWWGLVVKFLHLFPATVVRMN